MKNHFLGSLNGCAQNLSSGGTLCYGLSTIAVIHLSLANKSDRVCSFSPVPVYARMIGKIGWSAYGLVF